MRCLGEFLAQRVDNLEEKRNAFAANLYATIEALLAYGVTTHEKLPRERVQFLQVTAIETSKRNITLHESCRCRQQWQSGFCALQVRPKVIKLVPVGEWRDGEQSGLRAYGLL